MIVRRGDKVLVLGMTGKQGTFWTERMIAYGTRVVAGVHPQKAGTVHCGVPVFADPAAAKAAVGVDVAVLFVPPSAAKAAALSVIEAGIGRLVMLTEHIPLHDVLAVHAAAARRGTRILGPNTAGLVTPGECFVGIMPAFVASVFAPGPVGVISRSGSLGTLVCLNLTREGLGQSAFIGLGGDPVPGTTTSDALDELERDGRTQAVVLIGEIGGGMEEAAADVVARMSKPVVAFIAGAAAPPDTKMGHAGAIVSGGRGSHAGKARALERAGAVVVATPGEIPAAIRRGLAGRGPASATG
jgi:succinyl-CoA synthetase alpha subunit